ncbi:hypothetical protein EDC01DRAFT_626536 [Geopyxis carbonaria]|nr:hypothetical protein EDC01DRAFT_626536 [Geopyxis carbonaria]
MLLYLSLSSLLGRLSGTRHPKCNPLSCCHAHCIYQGANELSKRATGLNTKMLGITQRGAAKKLAKAIACAKNIEGDLNILQAAHEHGAGASNAPSSTGVLLGETLEELVEVTIDIRDTIEMVGGMLQAETAVKALRRQIGGVKDQEGVGRLWRELRGVRAAFMVAHKNEKGATAWGFELMRRIEKARDELGVVAGRVEVGGMTRKK